MLITVPSEASAKLGEILTPDQRTQFIADVMEQDGYLYFVLQNSGANAIYVESGADASVSGSVAVPPGQSISLKTDNLSKIRLVSVAAPNAARLLSVGGAIVTERTDGISNIDTADASFYYFGDAPIGTADSDAAWKISRMTKASPYLLRHATGGSASCVWNDRASLSYS